MKFKYDTKFQITLFGKVPKTVYVQFSPRKYLTLTLEKDKKVIIRAKPRTSLKSVQSFVDKKQPWLEKKILELENEQKIQKIQQQKIQNKGEIFILGEKIKLENKTVEQRLSELESDFLVFLQNEVQKYRTMLNIPANYQVKISSKFYKSKWGSCQRKVNIKKTNLLRLFPNITSQHNVQQFCLRFNLKLMLFSKQQVSYVVAHEVCHILEPNHSQKFWNLVKKVCPDYIELKKVFREKNVEEI